MPRVLLLLPSATYRAEAFLAAAAHLNLDVTLGVERGALLMQPPVEDMLTLNFREPDRSIEAVREFAAARPIDAVIGVDDRSVILAARIAAALGLPHNALDAVAAAGNKLLMRERLRAAGIPVPAFQRVAFDDDPIEIARRLSMPYPVVLKPLILSASCGVIRADDPGGFIAAFRRIERLLTTLGLSRTEGGRELLVEAFIAGDEVALEGLLRDGRLDVLAIFDKPDPLNGPFFEETLYVTPSRLPDSVQGALADCAGRAAAALGLREGPVHAELRINAKGPWLIELAARSIGGRCSDTLRFAADMSLEELILRHALRLDVPALTRRDRAAGVMMIPIPHAGRLRDFGGVEAARAVPGIETVAVTAQCGDRLVPLPEGTRYLGFIVARGREAAEVEAALREAHRRLTFAIEDEAVGAGGGAVRRFGI
jgi:biotin carboxylase